VYVRNGLDTQTRLGLHTDCTWMPKNGRDARRQTDQMRSAVHLKDWGRQPFQEHLLSRLEARQGPLQRGDWQHASILTFSSSSSPYCLQHIRS